MATLVGKKFPDLNVDAMNEMGDTFKVNVLEEVNKKVIGQELLVKELVNIFNIFKVELKSTLYENISTQNN